MEIFPVRIPYVGREQSSVVDTGGVSNVIVRILAEDGHVGYGECGTATSTTVMTSAVESMLPFVVGRNPWDREAMVRDILINGRWRYQETTATFAIAGIDMALWDLCAKIAQVPLYKLFGGALRESVDYFYYLKWDDDDGLVAQCADGIKRGYNVYYLKVGLDSQIDEHRLQIVREAVGPKCKLRIDANQSWTPGEAFRLIERWHESFNLDLVEAPIIHHPTSVMRSLKKRITPRIAADEGLRGEDRAYEIVDSECADVLCLSVYDLGTLSSLYTLAKQAARLGQSVCKHTWGELGIFASAMQNILLTLPLVEEGNQQTAQFLEWDIIEEPLPITTGPKWGRILKPGLGVTINEERLQKAHKAYLKYGEFPRTRSN